MRTRSTRTGSPGLLACALWTVCACVVPTAMTVLLWIATYVPSGCCSTKMLLTAHLLFAVLFLNGDNFLRRAPRILAIAYRVVKKLHILCPDAEFRVVLIQAKASIISALAIDDHWRIIRIRIAGALS
jgi:hypothetical protein